MEAWSTSRLSFEPKDGQVNLRAELREALSHNRATGSGEVHVARYEAAGSGQLPIRPLHAYEVKPAAGGFCKFHALD